MFSMCEIKKVGMTFAVKSGECTVDNSSTSFQRNWLHNDVPQQDRTQAGTLCCITEVSQATCMSKKSSVEHSRVKKFRTA